MNLFDVVSKMHEIGYETDDAQARVCQDIVLKAISKSTLSRNVTIKGGVVMRSITNNIRRATQDMDIDELCEDSHNSSMIRSRYLQKCFKRSFRRFSDFAFFSCCSKSLHFIK